MKKSKNILLLIGIIPTIVNLSISLCGLLLKPGQNISDYLLTLMLVNMLFAILVIVFPLALLFQNLKNKNGKTMAIVSIIASATYIIRALSFVLRSFPNYIVLSKLGLIDTYLTIIVSYVKNGGLIILLGQVAIIIGSVLSLRGKKESATTDSLNL